MDLNKKQGKILVERGVLPQNVVNKALQATSLGSGDLVETLLVHSYLKPDLAKKIRSLASNTQRYNDAKSRRASRIHRRDQLVRALSEELEEDPLFSPLSELTLERLEMLGEGGMGAVYRVTDKTLGRQAALMLLRDQDADESMRTRFQRETRLTANLDHPSIPPVFQAGTTAKGELYMLMKVIEGETLSELIKRYHKDGRPAVGLRELLGNLIKVLEAMDYSHSRGIIHRDLKPDNIMVGSHGEVMVMDWGIARDLAEQDDLSESLKVDAGAIAKSALEGAGLTQAGAVIGTPGYMPPEQAGGEDVDNRTDIYALGAILTEILTGRLPVGGANALARVVQTCEGKIKGPSDLDRSIDSELDAIARKALSVEADDRFQNAKIFVQSLQSFLAGDDLSFYHYSPRERAIRWARRHPSTLLIAILCSAVLVFSLLLVAQYQLAESQKRALEAETKLAKQKQGEADTARKEAKEKEKVERKKKQKAEAEKRTLQRLMTLINEAESLVLKKGNVEEIERRLEEVMRMSVGQESTILKVARIYKRGGFYNKAKSVLTELVSDNERSYEGWFQLHLLKLQDSHSNVLVSTDYMKKLVETARGAGAVNEFTLYYDALEAKKKGDTSKALELLNSAAKINKNMPWIYLSRAAIFKDEKRLNEALADCDKAVKLSPGMGPAYETRGRVYQEMRRAREALDDFNRAIELDPYFFGGFYNRGLLLDTLGKLDLALTDYTKSIELKGNFPPARYNRALVYSKKGQYRKALADYSQAIRFRGDWAQAYYNRGQCFVYLRQPKQALEDYSQSIELDPTAYLAYINRGVLLSQLGKHESALKDYDQALERGGPNAMVYANRAAIKYKLGRVKEALEDCNLAIKKDPKYAGAYANRGSMKATLGDKAGALKDFHIFLKLDPKNRRRGDIEAMIRDIESK
ncbi:MAG: tetratricopeptide repeat protein [Planctomycetota bacterium]|nr:tetratricopeptide repeat protein [Planctomycetota bacterium]